MAAETQVGIKPPEIRRQETVDSIRSQPLEKRGDSIAISALNLIKNTAEGASGNLFYRKGGVLEKFASPLDAADPNSKSPLAVAGEKYTGSTREKTDEENRTQSDILKHRYEMVKTLAGLDPADPAYQGQKELIEDARAVLDLMREYKISDPPDAEMDGGIMIQTPDGTGYTLKEWEGKISDPKKPISDEDQQAALWAFEKPAAPAPEFSADDVITQKIQELTTKAAEGKLKSNEHQALLRLHAAAMANGYFGAEIKQEALDYARKTGLITDVDGAIDKLQQEIDGRTNEERQKYGELSDHINNLGKEGKKAMEDGNVLEAFMKRIKLRDAAENQKVFALIFGQDVNRKDLEEFFDPNNRQRLEQQLKDGSMEVSGTLLLILLALGMDLGASVVAPPNAA